MTDLPRPKPAVRQCDLPVTGDSTKKILIAQWGGAADFFKSLPVMHAVMAAHPQSSFFLFVPPALVDMAKRSRLFDGVLTYRTQSLFDPGGRMRCYHALKRLAPDAVYDLGGRLPFAARAALAGADRRQVETAADLPLPPLDWMQTDVSLFGLRHPYVLLLPGNGAGAWPAVRYAAAAMKLIRDGYDVAVLGTDRDAAMAAKICRAASEVRDICGRTSYYDIYALAQTAAGMIGTASAALHLAGYARCPVVALLNGAADIDADTPRGAAVTVIQADDMAAITVDEVIKNLRPRGDAA